MRLRNAALAIDLRAEERLTSLAASKVASMQDKDRAAREARLSTWRLQAAKDDLQLQALEKARAETALDRRMLRSPIDGVVVARLHEPGEYIEEVPTERVDAGMHQRAYGHHRPLGHFSALQYGRSGGDIGMRSHAASQKGGLGADKSMITDTNWMIAIFNPGCPYHGVFADDAARADINS